MKYVQHILLTFFILGAQAYAGLSIDTTPVLPAGEVHPSLYFTADEVPTLQARMDMSPYSEWWAEILSKADSYLGQDLSSTGVTEDERSKGAKTCAFAHILTQDQQYLDKAREALLSMWTHSGSDNRRMLDASYHLQSYCEAYDWIQSTLDPSQDNSIRVKLATEAERFYDHSVMWSPFGYVNNWGVKAGCALATVALTIPLYSSSSHTPSQWLSRALDRIDSILEIVTTDDGLWIEGSHYLTYTSGNLLPFLWHYRKVSNVNFFDDLYPLFDFVLKARYPDGRLPNIEDAYSNIFPHSMVAPAFPGEEASFHMWAQENGPGFDTVWWTQDVKEVDLFIIHDSTIPALAPTGKPSLYFPDARVAVLRSGWDESGLYLYLNGAPDYNNLLAGGVHTHPDPLECLLYANKALLLNDAGYGPDGFNDDNRNWYTSPEAHNIILINGSAPQDPILGINAFMSSDYLSLVEMMAAYGWATISRSALLVGDEYAIVADHITSSEDKDCDFILHGRGGMTQVDRLVTWSTTNADSTEVELLAYLFPQTSSIELKSGLACFEWGQEETNHYIISHDEGRDVQFLTLLFPQFSGDPTPLVEEQSGELYKAALARDDLILFQKDTLTTNLDSLESDARLTFMRKESPLPWLWLLKDGRRLSWNTQLLMESNTRISITAEPPSEDQFIVHVSSGEKLHQIYLALPDSLWPSGATLEGTEVPFQLQDDGVFLEMNDEGTLSIDLTRALKGEVLLDGEINILDLVRTVHFIIDIGPPATRHELWAADVNYDGEINILDLLEIAYIILSIP